MFVLTFPGRGWSFLHVTRFAVRNLTMADLLLGCEKGDFAKAVKFIQQGSDPHCENSVGQTPLHFACR